MPHERIHNVTNLLNPRRAGKALPTYALATRGEAETSVMPESTVLPKESFVKK
jgi:hypothetical protein